jgi:hypothetical protein
MTSRKRVQPRRHLETCCFRFDNHGYTIGVGRELQGVAHGAVLGPVLGPVIEIFLNAEKVDSMADAISSDLAILISMLLQYGCTPEQIAKSMKRNPNGMPATLFGHVADLVKGAL